MEIILSRNQMDSKDLKQVDFVIVTGDAYIDHPSFGVSIIANILAAHNYSVAIIAQPSWKSKDDFFKYGAPRLGFLVTAGNIDSMVNHYTVFKKRRGTDKYSDGGEVGKRPDRATIVYTKKIREVYKNVPVIIGGIEASLRRLSHYDYWDDKVRKSILFDSDADLLVYGMAENSIIEIADALESGMSIKDLIYINGTVWKTRDRELIPQETIVLPSYEEVSDNKIAYMNSFKIQNNNTNHYTAKPLMEEYPDGWVIVQNPPQEPLSQAKMDWVYDLDYSRAIDEKNTKGVPAFDEVCNSLVVNRGCFGGCNFCALTYHQGEVIQSRSKASIISEANKIIQSDRFKGYINDVGGPTANFYNPSCSKQFEKGGCSHKKCLAPLACNRLDSSHEKYLDILRSLRGMDHVKKVFVRSGLRYDFAMLDQSGDFIHELVEHHVSGQLRVAPEHVNEEVLRYMGKPNIEEYHKFIKMFKKANDKAGLKQFVVPYLMSSHPGCTIEHAVELAEFVRDIGYTPEQVQDFYPTPGTMSTAMYYTELDPDTMQKIYVPKTYKEKSMQRALMQYRVKSNYKLVKEALLLAKREDLIGYTDKCLIRPRR